MEKIKVLNKNLSNLIAAGEVVEKPASVVKELVENSIDAGANVITIAIKEGGIKEIEITDNGSGIANDDVKTAFLPHATSKITFATDLNEIHTLGFRGEALASIAAVSEITMLTKTSNEQVGTKIELVGGEVKKFEEFAFNQGTKITVKNLFFNTPARRKFLNKPQSEEKEITKFIEKFLLSNPSIKFKYIIDGKVIYNTTGGGIYDNIYTIYGSEISKNLVEVHYSNDKFTLEGYIGNPSISKPNRSYQLFFVNGRMVKDFILDNAVQFAYSDYLMKGNFPVCFLNLKVPYDSVDVNIHPSKQQVRFENTREINSFLISAIKNALEKNRSEQFNEIFSVEKNIEDNNIIGSFKEEMSLLSDNFGSSYDEELPILKTGYQTIKEVYIGEPDKTEQIYRPNPAAIKTARRDFSFEQFGMLEQNDTHNYKIIGTIFSTYVILEMQDKVLVIDQHACHERKIYDKLIEQVEKSELAFQDLLVPYCFTCNTAEAQVFLENLDEFKKLGFEIDEFGKNCFKITQVPFLVKDINLGAFVEDIKKDLSQFSKTKKNLLKDYLAQCACKSAVKAGDVLQNSEIEALLKDLDTHKVLQCPHGRPIVFEVTRKDIEKLFKRIV